MKRLRIEKCENGFIIEEDNGDINFKTWIASSRYDISEICMKYFNQED